MLRVAVIVSAALGIAASASAQVTCAAGELNLPEVGYFEAHRPVIVKRKLSGEELAEAKRLTAEVKKGNPLVEAVDRLAVLTAAGDGEMMKTVMEGYAHATCLKFLCNPTQNLRAPGMPSRAFGRCICTKRARAASGLTLSVGLPE